MVVSLAVGVCMVGGLCGLGGLCGRVCGCVCLRFCVSVCARVRVRVRARICPCGRLGGCVFRLVPVHPPDSIWWPSRVSARLLSRRS